MFLPLMAMFLGIGTCTFTVSSHIIQGRHPMFPTISMSAYMPASTEYYVFAYGLCTSSSFLLLTGFIIRWRFWSQRKTWLARFAYLAGNICSIGLAVTSIVPLQPDIMEVLALPREKRKLSFQSNLHSGAANVFCLGALAHAVSFTILLFWNKCKGNDLVGVWSLRLKCLTSVLLCVFIMSPLLLFMYPKIIKGSRVTVVALNQYGAILSLLMFYGTYFLDLRGYKITLLPKMEVIDDTDPSDEYPYHKSSSKTD